MTGWVCPPTVPGADRLVLVGDAGYAGPDDPVLRAAAACAGSGPLLLLGDNAYGSDSPLRLGRWVRGKSRGGLGGLDQRDGEAQLAAQLAVLGGADLWVVPGNHDWYAGRRAWRHERDRVVASGARWLAGEEPCDGRTAGALLEHATVLGLDSMAAFRCRGGAALFTDELAQEPAAGWWVIAAHHPLATIGKHAGRSVTGQDADGPRYHRRWSDALRGVPDPSRVLLVAGHDHLLALLPDRDGFPLQIVSGAGSIEQDGANRTAHPLRHTDRWTRGAGFVVLDLTDGAAVATMVDAGGAYAVTVRGAELWGAPR